jgi:predicted nucleic acid-binding protein
MPAEVANVLRRAEAASEIARDTAALAHADLLALPMAYLPLATLDRRLLRAPGPRCRFVSPDVGA